MTKNTIHGTCGKLNSNSPCMIDGKYCKRYSRALISNTVTRNDEYPLYRRSAEDGDRSCDGTSSDALLNLSNVSSASSDTIINRKYLVGILE
uniref:Uncharacterized protein n=1 Tax=Onchocerca volvulus TaxID=6282 RepID=A0A8R1TL10_ONCVO